MGCGGWPFEGHRFLRRFRSFKFFSHISLVVLVICSECYFLCEIVLMVWGVSLKNGFTIFSCKMLLVNVSWTWTVRLNVVFQSFSFFIFKVVRNIHKSWGMIKYKIVEVRVTLNLWRGGIQPTLYFCFEVKPFTKQNLANVKYVA